MIKVGARGDISEVELDEVDAAILLNQQELLLFVEKPLEGRQGTIQDKGLLQEPLPVRTVENVY